MLEVETKEGPVISGPGGDRLLPQYMGKYLSGEYTADLAGDALYSSPKRIFQVIAANAMGITLRKHQP